MSVGGIRGGGGKGRAGGAGKGGGAGKATGAGKASGAGFGGKVDRAERAERLVGPSGTAASANVGATDPVTAQALEIAKQLKSGEIKTREEATKKLVGDILKERLHVKSKALNDAISKQLMDDPRLSQTLDRIWSKA